MAGQIIVPTERELNGFDLSNPEVLRLIREAEESDAADRRLKIMDALKKYKKAVFWAMILSTSLIMEGYDVVIVSGALAFLNKLTFTDYILLWSNTIL